MFDGGGGSISAASFVAEGHATFDGTSAQYNGGAIDAVQFSVRSGSRVGIYNARSDTGKGGAVCAPYADILGTLELGNIIVGGGGLAIQADAASISGTIVIFGDSDAASIGQALSATSTEVSGTVRIESVDLNTALTGITCFETTTEDISLKYAVALDCVLRPVPVACVGTDARRQAMFASFGCISGRLERLVSMWPTIAATSPSLNITGSHLHGEVGPVLYFFRSPLAALSLRSPDATLDLEHSFVRGILPRWLDARGSDVTRGSLPLVQDESHCTLELKTCVVQGRRNQNAAIVTISETSVFKQVRESELLVDSTLFCPRDFVLNGVVCEHCSGEWKGLDCSSPGQTTAEAVPKKGYWRGHAHSSYPIHIVDVEKRRALVEPLTFVLTIILVHFAQNVGVALVRSHAQGSAPSARDVLFHVFRTLASL
ncbi:unnamed protein product [Prorocentrum cordatum]|uniref:Subtilisin n=1 Tax=Prorocentrum cordatum TaxID=2364126 RepID=A0ABN9SUK1_9DINO|nr:unnamed protein product [Polarella glacialis]